MAFTDHRIIVVGKGSSGSGKSGPPAFVAQYPIGALRVSGDGKLLADLRFADNSHVRIKSSSDMAQIHQQLGQLS